MGHNKELRKKIEAHEAMIAEHQAKIRDELSQSHPKQWRVELWQKQIANAEAQIVKLERRLHRGKRGK